MITTHKFPYRNGELRIGWASWDDGSMTARSIKYAYPDASGKISRGSPELPFDILVDMLVLAGDQKEIDESLPTLGDPNLADPATMSDQDLKDEKTVLSTTLIRLQPLVVAVRWAEWSVYDQIGARLDAIRAEIARR
jgi:hypothetical protein